MSDEKRSEPVMAGSGDASDEERLSGLIEQVEQDRGAEGPGAIADELRDRLPETKAVPEGLGHEAD